MGRLRRRQQKVGILSEIDGSGNAGPLPKSVSTSLITGFISDYAQPILYYLATFYSGLALGQSLLALGAWGSPPGCWLYFLPIASAVSFIAILSKGIDCTQQAAAAAAATPTLTPVPHILAQPILPMGNAFRSCHSCCPSLRSEFRLLSFLSRQRFRKGKKGIRNKYMIGSFVSLAIGVGCSVVCIDHYLVSSFTSPDGVGISCLFIIELLFVKRIPELNKNGGGGGGCGCGCGCCCCKNKKGNSTTDEEVAIADETTALNLN